MPVRPISDKPLGQSPLTLDANTAGVLYRANAPFNGRVKKLFVIKGGAWTGAGVLTVTTTKGALTPTLTIPTGGALGDVFSVEFPAGGNNEVREDQLITVDCDGAPTAASLFGVQLVVGS